MGKGPFAPQFTTWHDLASQLVWSSQDYHCFVLPQRVEKGSTYSTLITATWPSLHHYGWEVGPIAKGQIESVTCAEQTTIEAILILNSTTGLSFRYMLQASSSARVFWHYNIITLDFLYHSSQMQPKSLSWKNTASKVFWCSQLGDFRKAPGIFSSEKKTILWAHGLLKVTPTIVWPIRVWSDNNNQPIRRCLP